MSNRLLGLLVFLALLLAAPCAASGAESPAAVRAWDAWRAGRLEVALTESSQAVADAPGSAYAWTIRGFVLSRAGQKDQALTAYRRAEPLAPRDATIQNNIGTVLLALGRLTEARRRFQHALALRPGYADALNNLGVADERLGRAREAQASYRQAVAVDPGHARARTNLGALALREGRTDEARRHFHQAAAEDPTLGAPRLNLLLLETRGAPDDRRRERLQQAAHDRSVPPSARSGALAALAAYHVASEDFETARALYLDAIALVPLDADLLNNVAVAEDQLGMHRDAMLHLQEALRIRPQSMVAHNNVGIVLVHRGDWDLAESVFEDIVARDPNFHRAHYNLGIALAAQGRRMDAMRAFERAAALAPRDASVQYNLGVMRRQLGGDDREERHSYERALALDGDLAEAHLALGCLLADPQTRADLRDEQGAGRHLRRFLELALPEDAEGRERASAWLAWLARSNR